MISRCCEAPGASVPVAPTMLRRALGLVRWLIPGITLTLMPKCPACLAAYVALWTGIGLSFTAAVWLRSILIVLAVISLAYLGATYVRRAILRFVRTQETAL